MCRGGSAASPAAGVAADFDGGGVVDYAGCVVIEVEFGVAGAGAAAGAGGGGDDDDGGGGGVADFVVAVVCSPHS